MTESDQTPEATEAAATPTAGDAPPAETHDPSASQAAGRKRRGGMLLYVALLIAGALAAWQGHEFLRARHRRVESAPARSGAGAALAEPAGRLDPRSLRNPLAGQGLRPLKHDPGLLPAPAGARFQFGMHRTQGEIQQYLFRYTLQGSDDDVRAHYARTMPPRGLKAAPSPRDRVLVFDGGGENVVVRLKPAGGRDGVVVIGVTWTRRGQSRQGARQ